MTAIATILALIPLGLGLSQGEIIASELATVVIGGLFTSTFLTLIVVPVVYSLVDDAKVTSRRKLGLAAAVAAEAEEAQA
jgi:HAE1 family hydrophobic/amphiphilic exporter-1